MHKLKATVLALLLLGGSLLAVEITGEQKVGLHKMARLSVSGDTTDAAILWDIDREELCDIEESGGRLLFTAPAGTYKVKARIVRLKEGKPRVETARLTVTFGEAGPTPGPGPGPTPPPVAPPIAGEGFRVLIIEESGDRAKLPAEQLAILFSKEVRDYLRSKCAKDKDNPTGAWRIWDKDSDASDETQSWQDALKRERKKIPWLIISHSAKGGYEGPLPANVADMMALLRKWGE